MVLARTETARRGGSECRNRGFYHRIDWRTILPPFTVEAPWRLQALLLQERTESQSHAPSLTPYYPSTASLPAPLPRPKEAPTSAYPTPSLRLKQLPAPSALLRYPSSSLPRPHALTGSATLIPLKHRPPPVPYQRRSSSRGSGQVTTGTPHCTLPSPSTLPLCPLAISALCVCAETLVWGKSSWERKGGNAPETKQLVGFPPNADKELIPLLGSLRPSKSHEVYARKYS